MTKTLIALVLAQLLCIGVAYAAPTVVKKADLPATLKGGKTAKNTDGIPGCATGRAKVDGDTMEEWASAHPTHACSAAKTMYVCRVGKNLSVRCE